MKETARQVTEIATSTKAGLAGVFITNLSAWWMDWGSTFISAATAIGGFVYIVIIVMLKWQEYLIKKHEIEQLNKLDKG